MRVITEITINTKCPDENRGILFGKNFFQSCEFGQFQTTIPYRGKAWMIEDCLVVKQKTRFGFCWLWLPYGPKIHSGTFWTSLAGIAKKERAIFARIEPALGWTDEMTAEVAALGKTDGAHWHVRQTKKRFTPEHTLVLDLEKNEEGILAQMKPKGRYNIGVAKRRGVTCLEFRRFEEIPSADFDAFYGILKKTAARDEFGIHPKFFYENLLKILGAKNMASLFLAYNAEKRVIAGLIEVFCGDTATYYYGASDHSHRELMAPYALQWSAILTAKNRGMKTYDFLGIASDDEKNHPWAGVTDFKLKFGGAKITYPQAFDVVYKPLVYAIKAW
jgi:lipid II:glycine glycyltransferase (peptidoglycan interpeptide bridge formation enzyme)